ncbi:MAG: SCO family protein [Bacteroidetes bacterium]|nr:SCO family protein [Bacteroidota bacterium]
MTSEHRPASKRRKTFLLFLLLVVLPSGFFLFRTGKHTFRTLPYIGEREVNGPGDTTYFTVPPFAFIDQDGNQVTDRTVADKVLVVDFFFTRCQSICPRMSKEMQQLQFKLDEPAFHEVLFLSHTVDPENDTPEVLKAYGRKLEADTARWKFVTGDAAAIYRQGNLGYLLSANADTAAAEQFVHSPQFVLVDKRRHIRGMYDGTNTESVNALADDIKLLLKEEHARAKKAAQAAR